MPQQYFTLITNTGADLILAAITGGDKINLVTMAVGDGNGSYYKPTSDMTSLKSQKWIGELSGYKVNADKNEIEATATIPANIGGFTIREIALFDENGTMIAVGNTPDAEKPVVESGASGEVSITMTVKVSAAEAVTFIIDPEFKAFSDHVNAKVESEEGVHGLRYFDGNLQIQEAHGWKNILCRPKVNPVLANNSWEIIANASQNYISSLNLTREQIERDLGWKIGDEIDITLSGDLEQTITLQIYDFNHDDLQNGGRAGITFGMKNLMTVTDLGTDGIRHMENTATNANSFAGSNMFRWLNEDVLKALPESVQSSVKIVNKSTSAGDYSSATRRDPMKIFLFSEIECFGATVYASPNEGSPYPIFTDNASRSKRRPGGAGSISTWWERSPRLSGPVEFCCVDRDGTGSIATSTSPYCVCFGFCV